MVQESGLLKSGLHKSDLQKSDLQIVRRPSLTFENSSQLDLLIQTILCNRGLRGEDDTQSSLSHLLPFHTLKGIQAACDLLFHALQKQSKVLIVGDFDADGATSTSVAIKGLRSLGFANLAFLVPDRFKFGYGLSPQIVEVALDDKPDLIITVDNGISSVEGVAFARKNGIDVLVTDHHLPGKEVPDANAILNPNQSGCDFPSKNLAGVGVMFYLLVAFRAHLRKKHYFSEEEPNLAELLDLVALGTVADIVPLDKNNRVLVQQGLARIRAGRASLGLQALIHVAKKNPESFKSSDLGFAIGPRLNAAGRLDSMSAGIDCLLSENRAEALSLAEALNDFNEDRKQIEQAMKEEALALLPELSINRDTKPIICLFDERWHQGVVGILASRLKERYHLPCIIFAPDDNDSEMLKGSARSISGLHMRDLLDQVASQYPDLLKKFGGHAMAAGMSIEKKNFVAFSEALCEQLLLRLESGEQDAKDLLQAKVYVDGELQQKHFSLEFAKTLQSFEPWGQQFPEPLFIGQFTIESQRILAEKHLKMTLRPEGLDITLDAIAFNVEPKYWEYEGKVIQLIFKLDINEFRGTQSLQLMVEHFIL